MTTTGHPLKKGVMNEASVFGKSKVTNFANIRDLERATTAKLSGHGRSFINLFASPKEVAYFENGKIKFRLRPSGMDYINLQGSMFTFTIRLETYVNLVPQAENKYLCSPLHIIHQFISRNGATELDNFYYYGKSMHVANKFRMQKGTEYGDMCLITSNVHVGGNFTEKDDMQILILPDIHDFQIGVEVQIPIYSILTPGGYLPVFTLAEAIDFEFILSGQKNCCWYSEPLIPIGSTCKMIIENPRIRLDCLFVTFGGKLTGVPFGYPSVGRQTYKNAIPTDAQDYSYSFSPLILSLKNVVSWLDIEPTIMYKPPDEAFSEIIPFGLAPSKENRVTEYEYSLNGPRYPFPSPVSKYMDKIYLIRKMEYDQDLLGIYMNPLHNCSIVNRRTFDIKEGVYEGAIHNYCISIFDRADQSSLISGLNVTRCKIDLIIKSEYGRNSGDMQCKNFGLYAYINIPTTAFFRFTMFTFNCYIIFHNAQIFLLK
jgi:hypothetical protein